MVKLSWQTGVCIRPSNDPPFGSDGPITRVLSDILICVNTPISCNVANSQNLFVCAKYFRETCEVIRNQEQICLSVCGSAKCLLLHDDSTRSPFVKVVMMLYCGVLYLWSGVVSSWLCKKDSVCLWYCCIIPTHHSLTLIEKCFRL